MNQFAKESVLDHVALQQLLNRKEFEERYFECAIQVLEIETKAVLKQWEGVLLEHNHLSCLKELYHFIREIRDSYKMCIELYDYNQLKDSPVKDILLGAISILRHGINSFPRDDENMVDMEDNNAVENAINNMVSTLKHTANITLMNGNADDFLAFGSNAIYSKIIHQIENHELQNFIKLQHDTLVKLNSLDERPVLRSYCRAVSEIITTLKPLQSVQMDMFSDKNEQGYKILAQVFSVIQNIRNKATSMQEFVEKTIDEANISEEEIIKSKSSFKQAYGIEVEEQTELNQTIQNYLTQKNSLMNKLYAEINDEINKSYIFSMRDIKNQSKEIQLLSCQILEAIKLTYSELSELPIGEIASDLSELLTRIVESVEIKCESLKEKNFEFVMKKREQWAEQSKQLYDFKENFMGMFEENFEKMLKESTKHMLLAQEKFNKLAIRLQEQSIRTDFEFLKKDLIFEVVTFEEIMNHSLPKLMDSDEQAIIRAREQLEKLNTKIHKVLIQSGITTITPASHEKFNGKEHEAIYVEEKEGYLKGEIIQVQTNGYSFCGVPIMRANTVVAK